MAQNNQQDQDQEIDFNALALAKFLSTSPDLGNYIISFKDVTDEIQNEDNSDLKVGIFILRVGQEVFYVPVVSKGDNVYPVDSVFFASVGKFYPLTKKTVELMITSSQLTQGKPTKIPSTVTLNPDMTQMIVPPRTGKMVYASASRLGDFLSVMPDYLKQFTMTKIAEEKSVYEELHKLFNIRDIFAALKGAPKGATAETNAIPVSVVTGVGMGNLTGDEITSILDKGYVVMGGELPTKRFAVSATNFDDGRYTAVTALDGNSDFELVLKNGTSRESFIPKQSNIGQFGKMNMSNRRSVTLFTNGDYAFSEGFVAVGTKLDRVQVLDTLFANVMPVLPRDVEVGDTFAIFDNEHDLIGVFSANRVVLSNLGVEIKADSRGGFPYGGVTINALRNYGLKAQYTDGNIYTPFSTLVLRLEDNVSGELEISVNRAAVKREITEAGLLGEQLNLGYDGVEFTVNGKVIGSEANMMSKLAVEEGIEPELATSFIKQAKEKKFAKIYLSKQAGTAPGGPGFNAGEIPQMGNPPPQVPKVGLNGSFMPNTQQALSIKDPQATEATIISELLQNPDMFGLIDEYVPDIEECIDKLGRVLLLARIHIRQLAENNDADGVFAFLSNLKNVYRMLGDNLIKLKELTVLKPNNNM